jgi:hypothetical protein
MGISSPAFMLKMVSGPDNLTDFVIRSPFLTHPLNNVIERTVCWRFALFFQIEVAGLVAAFWTSSATRRMGKVASAFGTLCYWL